MGLEIQKFNGSYRDEKRLSSTLKSNTKRQRYRIINDITCDEDVDQILLKAAGVEIDEKDEAKDQFKVQVCARCKEKNSPGFSFCGRCGFPLSLKAAFPVEGQRARADEIMNRLIGYAEVKALLTKKIAEPKLI